MWNVKIENPDISILFDEFLIFFFEFHMCIDSVRILLVHVEYVLSVSSELRDGRLNPPKSNTDHETTYMRLLNSKTFSIQFENYFFEKNRKNRKNQENCNDFWTTYFEWFWWIFWDSENHRRKMDHVIFHQLKFQLWHLFQMIVLGSIDTSYYINHNNLCQTSWWKVNGSIFLHLFLIIWEWYF